MATESTLSTNWPARLREARLAAGLTTRALAERADVSPSLVSSLEHGYQASAPSRAKIARALGFEPDALFPPYRPLPAAA